MITQEEIEVTWSRVTKKHYISKGYSYTNLGVKLIVNVNDLLRNSNEIVSCKCDYCGSDFDRKYKRVLDGRKVNDKDACSNCTQDKVKEMSMIKYGISSPMKAKQFADKLGRKKVDESIVREAFESRGYRMIGSYVNSRVKIEFVCIKHEDKGSQFTTYNNMSYKDRNGCKYCKGENLSEQFRKYKNIDDVREIFESKGCILLSNKYISVDHPLRYICENGHEGKVSLYEFQKDCYCKQCGYAKHSGENHHNWKGGITSANEKVRKSNKYAEWRTSVFKRDKYTCQCCGKINGMLQAHHIENFSDNDELRLDVNNGITMCERCHSLKFEGSFHAIYGTRNNTLEQLTEYINKIRILNVS